jgi:hypothetical protein
LGGTTITLASGGGALFPLPAPGQQFALTLNDLATQAVFETVWCTGRAGDVLTIIRAQEGTTAKAWGVGDYVWNGPTAGQMQNMVQTPHMLDASIAPIFGNTQVSGTFNASGVSTFGSTGRFASSVTATDPNTATQGGLNILGTTANGAGVALNGNGTTTPNKYIRAVNGTFDILNSAYNRELIQITDAGNTTVNGTLTATGTGSFGGAVSSASSGTFTDPLVGGVVVNPGPNGANIALHGTGTTPNKFIRAVTNQLQIVNSGYTAAIMSLDDAGNLFANGNVGAGGNINAAGNVVAANGSVTGISVASTNGNITALNGRLRASFGARGSGDPNAAVLLADFLFNPTATPGSGYLNLPNGVIIQFGYGVLNGDPNVAQFFPIAFPNACLSVVCTEGAAAGSWFVASPPTPTIHGVSGFVFNAWFHAGVVWSDIAGKVWVPANLTTSWIAIGY